MVYSAVTSWNLLLFQAHDRSSGKAKEIVEAQIHKEYEETQQYLSSELAKVQASLQGSILLSSSLSKLGMFVYDYHSGHSVS